MSREVNTFTPSRIYLSLTLKSKCLFTFSSLSGRSKVSAATKQHFQSGQLFNNLFKDMLAAWNYKDLNRMATYTKDQNLTELFDYISNLDKMIC